MTDVEAAWISEVPARQHMVAGVVACGLSLGIHVAALFCLSNVRFDVPVPARRARRMRRSDIMRLTHVERQVASERRRPARLRPGDAALTADLAREADVLGVRPDEAAIEPPALIEDRLAGETKSIAEPSAVPKREPWQPRQEILVIEDQIVADEVSTLSRKRIPRIERVSQAPDVVVSVDRATMEQAVMSAARQFEEEQPEQADITQKVLGGRETPPTFGTPVTAESHAKVGSGLFTEDASEVTAFKPIENLLTAEISTYTTLRDLKYGYFRIEIKRAGAEVLPVIPKDIVLVQDSSASMAEQRLHFCRDGLIGCLSEIGPEDRFNVVGFKESSKKCFKDWSGNKPQAAEQAKRFIEGMESGGNTDIFSSLSDLMKLKRTPGRPIIALLVTDGRPTTGLTGGSDIIGEFSKLNDGAVSVFAMGTVQTANLYFLDLLSYCNRGDSFVVTRGRWDIPDSMQRLMREVSRPVMADLRFRFAEGSRCEVYPVLTGNLYLDRALVLYGRYRRGTRNIVFQVVGQGGDVKCDMVFNLELGKAAKSGDKSVRQNWAKQKIYHLIGEYARKAEPGILKEVRNTAKAYRIQIPHKGRF